MRTDPNSRFYELMSISVPDGTPEELIETADAISKYVTDAGGEMLRSSNDSPWGRRRLAYPIRYHSADLRDGIYTLYHFQIQPAAIEDIEREIRLNERIIRYLLLQLDKEPVFVEETEEVTEGESTETAAEGGETVTAEVAEAIEAPATAEVAEAIEAPATAEVAEAIEAPATENEAVAVTAEETASEEE